ncbi:response regulator transcription factor [Nocardioides sp. TF02-7]|uniref:response regulator n=1 Tax=Nocardioides sp. TF02-7 TaxID=2917724 RepID=UPI001F06D53B|nr:response regulator transcription factor [Nocardioides sp. TF02-7]UMG91551.1 response regulator transcription factor [Nocardioides sp. TF02-7]
MSAPVRVLLADDQHLVRSGFRLILSVEDDVEVVGEAVDGADAVRQARALRPDVVLMDVQMPGTDGVEATRQVVAEGLAKVVMLTTFDRDDYLFDALAAGASGFLLKNADPDRLVEAVRAVAGGHALLAPEVTLRVIERMTRTAPEDRSPSPEPAGLRLLTDRELEVLLLLAEGLSNAEIAGRLVVGEATVKTHVSACLAKLGLRDRVQAVVWVHQHGLLRPGEDPG